MKSDAERATVQIVDVNWWKDPAGPSKRSRAHHRAAPAGWVGTPPPAGTSGAVRRSRPSHLDWAASARDSYYRGVDADKWVRIEWSGAGDDWLDLIGNGPDDTLVRLRLQRGEEGPYVVALEMSAPPSKQVGIRLLRRVGLDDPLAALDWALMHPDVRGIAGGEWCRRIRRPGRAGRPDFFYAEWAERYVAAIVADPVAPIQHLVKAEEAAGRHVTESGVKAIINKARRTRGLLTDTPPGEPGGELTPKAKKILGRG